MDVHSVSVIGKEACLTTSMRKDSDIWVCEIELPPGEHLYKFLINEELPVFDPFNNLFELDETGELWSLLVVDNSNVQLFNLEEYHVNGNRFYRFSFTYSVTRF